MKGSFIVEAIDSNETEDNKRKRYCARCSANE